MDYLNSLRYFRRSLEIHKMSVHINTDPKFICPRCGKKFKDKRALVKARLSWK
jgi:transposase-like protein